MALTPLPIRLFCDLASPGNLNDLNRNSQPPSFYRGDDVEIDIGLGENGSLLTSVSNVASVTTQLFAAENDTSAPMMSCTTSTINTGLTQTQWTNNTTPFYHAAFLFPNSQTAVGLNGQASVNYWLRITAQTTDSPAKTITLLNGPITRQRRQYHQHARLDQRLRHHHRALGRAPNRQFHRAVPNYATHPKRRRHRRRADRIAERA